MAAIEEGKAIQPAPAVIFDIERTEQNIKQWDEVKKKVLSPSDTIRIGKSTYIKRSGWRKLALAANVATTIVEVKTEAEGQWEPSNEEGDFTAMVKARATASWGRSAEDLGTYSASEFIERGSKQRLPISRHNVVARAATRAINRAVSDLVGGGVVSAEEMSSDAAQSGPGDTGRDELNYAIRDYTNFVHVEEGVDGVLEVKITGSLSKEEFSGLSKEMDGVGYGYIPKAEGGPGFRPKK